MPEKTPRDTSGEMHQRISGTIFRLSLYIFPKEYFGELQNSSPGTPREGCFDSSGNGLAHLTITQYKSFLLQCDGRQTFPTVITNAMTPYFICHICGVRTLVLSLNSIV